MVEATDTTAEQAEKVAHANMREAPSPSEVARQFELWQTQRDAVRDASSRSARSLLGNR